MYFYIFVYFHVYLYISFYVFLYTFLYICCFYIFFSVSIIFFNVNLSIGRYVIVLYIYLLSLHTLLDLYLYFSTCTFVYFRICIFLYFHMLIFSYIFCFLYFLFGFFYNLCERLCITTVYVIECLCEIV